MIADQLKCYHKLVDEVYRSCGTPSDQHFHLLEAYRMAFHLWELLDETDLYSRTEYIESDDREMLTRILDIKEHYKTWLDQTSSLLAWNELPDTTFGHHLDTLRIKLIDHVDECSNWILKPASVLFAHDKFTQLRDEALDQAQQEKT